MTHAPKIDFDATLAPIQGAGMPGVEHMPNVDAPVAIRGAAARFMGELLSNTRIRTGLTVASLGLLAACGGESNAAPAANTTSASAESTPSASSTPSPSTSESNSASAATSPSESSTESSSPSASESNTDNASPSASETAKPEKVFGGGVSESNIENAVVSKDELKQLQKDYPGLKAAMETFDFDLLNVGSTVYPDSLQKYAKNYRQLAKQRELYINGEGGFGSLPTWDAPSASAPWADGDLESAIAYALDQSAYQPELAAEPGTTSRDNKFGKTYIGFGYMDNFEQKAQLAKMAEQNRASYLHQSEIHILGYRQVDRPEHDMSPQVAIGVLQVRDDGWYAIRYVSPQMVGENPDYPDSGDQIAFPSIWPATEFSQ